MYFGASWYFPRYDSETEIGCLYIRAEVLSIRNIEHCNACRVPGTAPQHPLTRSLIVIAIVIVDIWIMAVVTTVD
jgi:hypothetical protein